MHTLYKIIPFHVRHGNCGGSLVQYQQGDEAENALPFEIGKVLVSSDMTEEDVRGNHAHYETEEIIVALKGGCTFELDDGRGNQETVCLSAKRVTSQGPIDQSVEEQAGSGSTDVQPALLLYPHLWRTFYNFEPGTVLLVVANMKYDETDYIRDRNVFDKLALEWQGLGGSAD